MKNCKLIWTDLETGGLDGMTEEGRLGCQHYPILEFGVAITDHQLKEVGEPLRIVVNHDEDELDKLHPKAKEMHEKSGLLDEVRASKIGIDEAEKIVIEHLTKNGVNRYDRKTKTGGILAGSSVHFDRSYIKAQLIDLNDHLHYRQIDLSSLALAYRAWRPVVEKAAVVNKTYQHRAIADIRETIAEAKVYKTFMQQLQ